MFIQLGTESCRGSASFSPSLSSCRRLAHTGWPLPAREARGQARVSRQLGHAQSLLFSEGALIRAPLAFGVSPCHRKPPTSGFPALKIQGFSVRLFLLFSRASCPFKEPVHLWPYLNVSDSVEGHVPLWMEVSHLVRHCCFLLWV